jgi:HSP20 family protein
MNGLQLDVDRLFKQTARATSTATATGWTPPVDIQEENDRFVIYADVPGVDGKDLEITLEESVLSLAGKRHFGNSDSTAGSHRAERRQGEFVRRFRLPESAEADGLEAECRDGVLTIYIPKKRRPEPRRIEVSTA